MAGTWIKMRTGINDHPAFREVAKMLSVSDGQLLLALYHAASWFATHSKYGLMREGEFALDYIVGCPGFADALFSVGWLRRFDNSYTLHYFCNASAQRKSLGAKVRRDVLSAGKCAACGATDNLVIDHIVPIKRGGGHGVENLQALCRSCNIKKHTKTMEEFMRLRSE